MIFIFLSEYLIWTNKLYDISSSVTLPTDSMNELGPSLNRQWSPSNSMYSHFQLAWIPTIARFFCP